MRSRRMFANTLTWDPQNESSNAQHTLSNLHEIA